MKLPHSSHPGLNMPRQFSMSWEGHPHYRWVKMYRGTRYRVHCSELPLPRTQWTREGSASAANTWWERKRAEIDLAAHQDHPQRVHLDELDERVRAGQALGVPAHELRELAEERERVEKLPAGADPAVMKMAEAARLNDPLLAGRVLGREDVWKERKRVAALMTPQASFVL